VSDPIVTGEARLDNRGELLRALDLDSGHEDHARIPDLVLILKAYQRWGDACACRLLGDFAFVVRDDRTGRVFGARDHLGAKPFYYRASAKGLAFATRASAIADVDGLPLELDESRLADVCVPALECVDRTSTFYLGVRRLPPGHRLTCEAGRVAVASYWTPEASREVRFANDIAYAEAFREVFGEAVRCRLTGPSASMLSGGIDSSVIVGHARALLQADRGPALTTLSAVTDDPGCEESRHIRAVLGLQGLDPITIRPGDVAAFRDEIDAFVGGMEEPFDSSMIIPLLSYGAARRNGFDAVLDGVDGDIVASHEPDILAGLLRSGSWGTACREARGFAGFYSGTYDPWSAATRLLAVNAGRAFAPEPLRAAMGRLKSKRAAAAAVTDSILSRDFAARIDVAARLRALWAHRSHAPGGPPRERQARELAHPQVAAALERYHRVAASQGIEARHPFFDKRVVEFCLALPWDQKIRDGWSKWIVRSSSGGLLPDAVLWRRGRWVRLGWRFLVAVIAESGRFLADELSSDMDELAPYVDLAKVRALYDRYRRGDLEAAEPSWTAAVLSSWLRKTRSKRYDRVARANGQAAPPCLPLAG
jgi:asparagine synthase (glutamine-hydrolysing)